MFHVVAGLLALYVICRFILPLSCRWPVKLVLAVLVVLAGEHHLITRTFFGTMASPEVPFAVLVVAGWGFCALILMALAMMVRDGLGIATYAVSRSRGRALLGAGGPRITIAAMAVVLAAIGVREAVRVPDVKTVEITLPRWPQALDGYRIVQLTDLHASRLLQGDWIDSVVTKTNARNPDLIVLTGDMVDGTPEARADDVSPLKKLTAHDGVIAIAGNHEYYADYPQWLATFDRLGLRMLLNEHTVITQDGASFVLAGTTDMIAPRFRQGPPNVTQALEGAPIDLPVILLSHRPASALGHAAAGADLQLSGHTHGGQAWGMHWLVQYLNDGYVSGSYQVGNMHMYVSNGAGLWPGFPIRLGKRSEITEIIMRAPTAPGARRE